MTSDSDPKFNQAKKDLSQLTEYLLIASTLALPYMLSKGLSKEDIATLSSAVREDIKAEIVSQGADIDVAYFTFEGYHDDTLVKMLMSHTKEELLDSGVPEKLLTPYVECTPAILDDMVSKVIPLPDIQISTEVFSTYVSDSDFTQYSQLMNEVKSYGALSDPKTVENKAWQNSQDLLGKIGDFGGFQSEKMGLIDTYRAVQDAGTNLLIPWINDPDSNVCDECVAIADAGPYSPDDIPEPPHYDCHCWLGDPILDMSDVDMSDM